MQDPVLTREEVLELASAHDLHSLATEIFIRLELDELDFALAEWERERQWDDA